LKKKSILLACPTSVHFVQEYIENVLDDSLFDIYFLTWRTNLNEEIWHTKNVKVLTLINDNESKIINILKLLFRLISIKIRLRKLDIIHYHFIDKRFTHLVDFFVGKNAQKIILTFWGSDLLREPEKSITSFSKLYKRSNKINVMNIEMFNKFQKITKSQYSKKLISLDFGDSTLDSIKVAQKNKSIDNIRKAWNIPEDKIIVHLGYNGFEAQQHIKMIKSLDSCNTKVKKSIFLIVPLSYGCPNEKYKNQIIQALKDSGINFYILDKFIDKDSIGEFRLTADIFLYGQTTDAISASMIEYFATGSTVIKPKWLIYSELTDNGITMIEYKDFNSLTNIFENVILQKLYKNKNKKNSSIIYSLKSWNSLKNQWLKMYDEN
jgi:hypothetical protein